MAASPYVWGTRTKILCKYADGRECKLYLGHLTKPENVQSAQVWRGRSSATNWPMRTEPDCPLLFDLSPGLVGGWASGKVNVIGQLC